MQLGSQRAHVLSPDPCEVLSFTLEFKRAKVQSLCSRVIVFFSHFSFQFFPWTLNSEPPSVFQGPSPPTALEMPCGLEERILAGWGGQES